MKPVAARPAARFCWMGMVRESVRPAAKKAPRSLAGWLLAAGSGEEGLVGEGVGAGGAADFGGGVGEVFELAGVVPNTNAGMGG